MTLLNCCVYYFLNQLQFIHFKCILLYQMYFISLFHLVISEVLTLQLVNILYIRVSKQIYAQIYLFRGKKNISSKALISSFPTLSFLLFSSKPYLVWLLNNSPISCLTSLPIAHFILIDHFHFFIHVKNALSFHICFFH